MGFASLGSGSRGNGTLVALGDALFLIDCGFNLKQAERRLANRQVSAGDITAILVSHEHSDHIAGVAALAHRYALPVYASHGTLSRAPKEFNCQPFDGDVPFELAGVTIDPVCVPHDAREPTQFTLSHGDEKIGVLSDLGTATRHVLNKFSDCSYLLLEANHDHGMLMQGKYPASLKRRVAANFGHLSNEQAAELLAHLAHPQLHVMIGHISEQNNSSRSVSAAFDGLRGQLASLGLASQSDGFDWIGPRPITRQVSFDKVM